MRQLPALPDHDATSAAAAPILLDVTVPRFTGFASRIVRAALGVADLATLFDEARVGTVDAQDHHSTFRIALDHGIEAGGRTKMGPVLVGNDNGQLRVTLPVKWGGALRLAGYTPQEGTEPDGTAVCRTWITPKAGQGLEVPVPLGRRGVYRLEVRVVG